jgi:ABC-type polysaccharide/polyol phosphate export permease
MTATYRDLVNAVPFALQSGFLLTPVLYSYAMVPPEWRATYALLNPLSVVSDLWRHALAGSALVSTPRDIGFACLTSLLLLLAGLALFQHGERAAMKDC